MDNMAGSLMMVPRSLLTEHVYVPRSSGLTCSNTRTSSVSSGSNTSTNSPVAWFCSKINHWYTGGGLAMAMQVRLITAASRDTSVDIGGSTIIGDRAVESHRGRGVRHTNFKAEAHTAEPSPTHSRTL